MMFINVATETVTEMTTTFLLSFDEFSFEWIYEQSVFAVASFPSKFFDVVVDVVPTVVAVAIVLAFVAFVINLYIGS